MDLHISVIADFKSACPEVEVVDWCLSAHHWVMGRPRDVPRHINHMTWQGISPQLIADFQREYDSFLQQFDLFIVAHASVFAMIFEKYDKPILMLNSVRYDLPFCWTKDRVGLARYQGCLRRLAAEGRLFVAANNHADKLYLQAATGIDAEVIPSLGLYTGATYAPTQPQFVLYHPGPPLAHPLIAPRPQPHRWSEITAFRGLISFPYETSLMSLFEYFSAGMPLFFPTKEYWRTQLRLQSVSAYWGRLPAELAAFEDPAFWIEHSDVYRTFASPNTHYFASIPQLCERLDGFVYVDDRASRQQHIDRVKGQWQRLLDAIASSGALLTASPRA